MEPRRMDVEKEFDAVCALVNSAYEVETGDSGVAFKKRQRFHEPSRSDDRLIQTLKETWVLERDGGIVGCVRLVGVHPFQKRFTVEDLRKLTNSCFRSQ